MKHVEGDEAAKPLVSGKQVLIAQAALLAGLTLVLLVKEIPGMVRELKIYRMTGGLGAGHRYP
ncbi:hypothetical protein [Streptomyces sp. LaPpAH-108]|uniref:hypothetical protein n=1 Tax=Streptomyces sp. LaPpAH-108 TaxID=1155714 RepID=UPI00036EF8FB|nr:hypothetical protein [Streptomyces sp. LaPpAH-108]